MSGTLRPPSPEDAPAVAHVLSEYWPEPVDEETVLRSWTAPGVELQRDARLGTGSYAMVQRFDRERVWIDVGGRASEALLDWAESRAVELGSRLFSGAWSDNGALLAALEGRGFQLVRHSHRMEIDLSKPIPEPAWPEGLEMRTFRRGDERVLYELHQETFRDSWEPIEEPYDEWAHWMLEPPAFVPDLWFLAFAPNEAAGFAVCHPRPGSPDLGWVRVLGVRRAWRRRGLGRALLLHAFREFRRRGLARAGLGVDAESLTGANRLYESAGMHVSARFDIYEKERT